MPLPPGQELVKHIVVVLTRLSIDNACFTPAFPEDDIPAD
jgi:hypothetical protein